MSAEQLRAKSGKTCGLCAGKGLVNFCRSVSMCDNRAKRLQPVVLPDLQGKGYVRQRSISADLIIREVICFFQRTHENAALSLWFFSSRKRTKASVALADTKG
jgi:hypothetical protein